MSTSQQTDPLIGRLVDGRYRVRARIARGGMATVYVATDLRLERRVALKVMHSHLSDDTVFQSRFIQEARAAARLADPHVVNVFDQGQDGEMAYLVMEYLPGITMRELLREQKRLSIPQTITIMDAVLSGLAAAHRAGIVHRDVKPENVLLAEDGRIKIGDFGLARATSANTATGQMLLGTIAYLAPELVTRGTADARSDIYALGIMLYEMLVGEQPYKGEQPMQIAYQHATDSVPRPSARNPAIPEQLDELWPGPHRPGHEEPEQAQRTFGRLGHAHHHPRIGDRTCPQCRGQWVSGEGSSLPSRHEHRDHDRKEPDMYNSAVHDEATGLAEYVDTQLEALRASAHGLTEEQARLTPTRSALSIGGIIKHTSYVIAAPDEKEARVEEGGEITEDAYAAFMDTFALRAEWIGEPTAATSRLVSTWTSWTPCALSAVTAPRAVAPKPMTKSRVMRLLWRRRGRAPVIIVLPA